ncbi:hypothetical protein ODZ84_13175 [Chryseobacterium fluminis]|uniref:bacteriocin-like protein n=1 Tax=Chryseobacterium fluminis TaxID=2983606 RepID=UPI0022521FFC|nr:hypothetical protein [Chryseobacterium sp. MMS21-Ot14]UZT96177.1 hypothetical protein ODZ84_13175 [Chryseobacterium sp. MMS21-Ot14]
MKNLKKITRQNLKEVLGGHTCPGNLIHLTWNGYHACCITPPPAGNPCNGTSCLIPVDMCDGGIG